MQSITKLTTIINSSDLEDVDIKDTNEAYHELTDTALIGSARRVINHLSEADQQTTNVRLEDAGFPTSQNEIHHIRHSRIVNLDDTQGYPSSSEDSSFASYQNNYQNNGNNTKYDTPSKNTSKLSWCCRAIQIGCSFFTSLYPMAGNKLGDFNLKFKPREIASSLVNLCYPCVTFIFKCSVFLCTVSHSGASDNINTSPSFYRKKVSTNIENMNDIPKDINNIEMLNNIGRHPSFPSNGTYRLTDNLDGRGFTAPLEKFSGILDGHGYIISGLNCCLVTTLSGNAVIKNLTVSDANILNSTCASVITMRMVGNAKIASVMIKNCHVSTSFQNGYDNFDGIVAEFMTSNSCIENTHVKDCTIIVWADFGGCFSGGMHGNSKSINNTVTNCNVILKSKSSFVGCLSGVMGENAKSSNDYVSGCNCIAGVEGTHAGIATGEMRGNVTINNGTFINSTVIASGSYSKAAIVPETFAHGNLQGTISDSTAIDCNITANASHSSASIWTLADPKYLRVENCKDINCTVVTAGPSKMTTTEFAESTTTESVESTTTKSAESTTTKSAESTTIEQTVNAPLLLIGGGVVLGATLLGAICVYVSSLSNGYKDGKYGRALLMHPLHSCVQTLDRFYQRCRGNLPLQQVDGDIEMDEIRHLNDTTFI